MFEHYRCCTALLAYDFCTLAATARPKSRVNYFITCSLCVCCRKHIHLVFGFINGASHMVRGDGGIHVSHKDCYKPSVTRKIKFLQCI